MSIDREMDKDVVHIYSELLLSHEKENNAICSDMDRPTRDYTKYQRQIPYDIT